ncbi:MAG: hypothetical protein KQJ78_19600 [Deltaproteobacteria bacterium]|nr:hypothetical protein [Deltaproteobacteria bacterium]
MPPKTTIISDFDPMTTAFILEKVNMDCRIFRGYEAEDEGADLEFVFNNGPGLVTILYSQDPEGDTVRVSFQKHVRPPKLRIVPKRVVEVKRRG